MNVHKNSRLTPYGRGEPVRRVLEDGETPKTAAKWVVRFRAESIAGLQDLSSRPDRLRQPTPEHILYQIEAPRRLCWTGPRTAAGLGLSPSTVSRVLCRLGLNRIREYRTPPAHEPL